MNTDLLKSLTARQRRAVAFAALALIAIAIAGFVYLRPTPKSPPSIPASAANPLHETIFPVAFDFITPLTGWASMVVVGPTSGAQLVAFRTTDGARHWQKQLAGQSRSDYTPNSYSPISVQLFGKTHGFMTLGYPIELLYRTADGGAHWIALSLPSLTVAEVQFSDASNGWLTGYLQASDVVPTLLFATHDAGESWTRLPDPPAGAGGLALRRPTEAWLGSFGPGPPHVFRTGDSGQSWVQHDLPPPAGGSWTPDPYFPSFPTRISLLPATGALAWVEAIKCVAPSRTPGDMTCLNASADTYLFRSEGVSDSWGSVPPPPGPVAYQDATHWWATGRNALYKSTDAGQSWNQVATISPDWQFTEPGILDSKHGWASVFVMGGYGLALTNDGGLHWSLANVPQATVSF